MHQMEKAEEDILHEAYIMIQNEIAAMKNKESREVSIVELEGRRKLLRQREEIADKIFAETAQRLLAFTRSEAYPDYLCGRVRECAAQLPDTPLVIRLKKDDQRLADSVAAASGHKTTVEESADIAIGGFILVNAQAGLLMDETIDRRLADQRDWFASASGLTLGL